MSHIRSESAAAYGKAELDAYHAELYRKVDQATDLPSLREVAREAVSKLWQAERALLNLGAKRRYGQWVDTVSDEEKL
jgi:hypothetical protein